MISSAAERWVVNASPIILLGKAGIVHLLPKLCTEPVVPEGVLSEAISTFRRSARNGHWLVHYALIMRVKRNLNCKPKRRILNSLETTRFPVSFSDHEDRSPHRI